MATYRYKSSQRFEVFSHWERSSGVNPGGGEWESKSRRDKPVYADLEITIDVEGLMRALGARAVKSKARKSAALHGLIKCKAVKVRDA